MANGYYISHTEGEGRGGEEDGNVLTITVDGLPTAYPTGATVVTLFRSEIRDRECGKLWQRHSV